MVGGTTRNGAAQRADISGAISIRKHVPRCIEIIEINNYSFKILIRVETSISV